MAPLRKQIIETLPSLRRYACALTGDRNTGDEYIRVALMVLAEDPRHLRTAADVKFQLYKLFHRVLDVLIVPVADALEGFADSDPYYGLKRGLMALPLLSRKLLLLTTMQGFALERAAELLGLPVREARLRLVRARMQFSCLGAPSETLRPEQFFERRAA